VSRRAAVRGDRVLLGWGLLYLVAGVALATASAWGIYRTPRLVVVAAVGLTLGIGAVLLVRAVRWPPLAIPAVVAAGYLVLVVPVAIPSALASPLEVLRGVRDGVVGIVVGWKQLLTLSLPLGEYQAVLVPFFVLVVVGSAVVAHLVSRDGPGTAGAAGVVVAMTAFGIVFGSSETSAPFVIGPLSLPAPRELGLGLGLVLASVLWLVVRARLRRAAALRVAQAQSSSVRQGAESAAPRLRRQLAGVTLVAVALLAGLVLAPVAQALAPREALRDDVDPLVVVQQQPSPLAAYRSWFTDERSDAELFTVAGVAGVERLRLVALDAYDGDQFRVATGDGGVRYVRLPGGTRGDGAQLHVTIGDGFQGIWMPLPPGVGAAPTFEGPRATELADGFYLDASSGSAIDVAATESGHGLLPGDSYRVAGGSGDPASTFTDEAGAEAGISPDDYPELAAWVERQGVPRTGGGLVELVGMLRERGYLSHSVTDGEGSSDWIADLSARAPYTFLSSRAGHSAARVEELFAELNAQQQRAGDDAAADALVAAVGDDEQFAAASALLARYLGFESRVVLGVRLASDEPAPGVAVCVETCTGSNLSAWVEVRATTGGWTPLDVTPQYEVAPVAITDGEKLPENPTTPDQPDVEPLDPPQAQRDDSEIPEDPTQEPTEWWDGLIPVLTVAGTVSLTLLLLVLPLLVLAIAKAVRRRSRRRTELPEVSLVAAWSELVAGYLDHGLDVPERVSRPAAAHAVRRERAVLLADVVDRAVFAEHPPEPAASRAAWELVDAERRALADETPFRRRLVAAVTPASLLRDLGASRATLLRRLPAPRKVPGS